MTPQRCPDAVAFTVHPAASASRSAFSTSFLGCLALATLTRYNGTPHGIHLGGRGQIDAETRASRPHQRRWACGPLRAGRPRSRDGGPRCRPRPCRIEATSRRTSERISRIAQRSRGPAPRPMRLRRTASLAYLLAMCELPDGERRMVSSTGAILNRQGPNTGCQPRIHQP